LPLANQGLRNNKEDTLGAFSAALGDDETGLDGLTQPDFVREDAPTLAETPEGEDDGVDLMRIRIDPRLTLGCSVPLTVVGSTDPDQILGEHPQIEVVHRDHVINRVPNHHMARHGDTVAGKKIELIVKDDGAVAENTKLRIPL
jgi:hypothetical protein